MVPKQCQLVSDEKLERYQRETYREYQAQIFNIWDDYSEKKISPRTLLKLISKLRGPSFDTSLFPQDQENSHEQL